MRLGWAWLMMVWCAWLAGRAEAGSRLEIRTALGPVELELYDRDKPETVRNFLRYVWSGRFANSFVQRWEPGFVIQGGGFTVTNRGTTNADFASLATYGMITNEYSVGRTFSNGYGTIAMARAGGITNSATSQWFINLKDNSRLDGVEGGFTVFGRVMSGTNVLERFNTPTVANGIFQLDLGGALSTLPVLSNRPTYEDLVYTEFRLLQLDVGLEVRMEADGSRRLFWHSLAESANVIEVADELGGGWRSLATVNGDGSRMEFRDAEALGVRRFYRVRVE